MMGGIRVWRMLVSPAKRYKDLEKEYVRLKRLLAGGELDKANLKQVTEKNF